jgi:hypothetical protein
VLDYSVQVFDAHIDSASRVVEMEKRREDIDKSANKLLGPTARATIKVRTLNVEDEVCNGSTIQIWSLAPQALGPQPLYDPELGSKSGFLIRSLDPVDTVLGSVIRSYASKMYL